MKTIRISPTETLTFNPRLYSSCPVPAPKPIERAAGPVLVSVGHEVDYPCGLRRPERGQVVRVERGPALMGGAVSMRDL